MYLSQASFSISVTFFLITCVSCRPNSPSEGVVKEESIDASFLDQITELDGEVTFTLEDAEGLNREYPNSFWIPSRERRENLVMDDLVKLVFNLSDGKQTQAERMWVLVKSVGSSRYIGVPDNDPYSVDQIKTGLEITFEPRHVIDIYEVEISESDEAEEGGAFRNVHESG
ncbi:MAG: hypothetical protein ACN4GF_01715 [Lentimonas sp.]